MILELLLAASTCGVERWPVKVMSDPQASKVDLQPIDSTVSELGIMPPRCSKLPATRMAGERKTYRVTATILLVKKEADGDYHVALVDDTGSTMIVELPNPKCATGSVALKQITRARSDFERLKLRKGAKVTVIGVGFYDFSHGQSGMSRSCMELHPVLEISRAKK